MQDNPNDIKLNHTQVFLKRKYNHLNILNDLHWNGIIGDFYLFILFFAKYSNFSIVNTYCLYIPFLKISNVSLAGPHG